MEAVMRSWFVIATLKLVSAVAIAAADRASAAAPRLLAVGRGPGNERRGVAWLLCRAAVVALLLMLPSMQGGAEELDRGLVALALSDYPNAVNVFQSLAEAGNAEAQQNMGALHFNGIGVPQSDAEAVKWYRRAAEQGLAISQSNLGYMLMTGRGVAEDDTLAAEWLRKAAEQGFAEAQNNLGVLYEDGRGVRRDLAEALMLYGLAAEGGYSRAAKNRDRLKAAANAGQIAEAERLARQWLDRHRPPPATEDTTGSISADLPDGVAPLREPLALRYRPIDHFVLRWGSFLSIGGQSRRLEAFAMEGSATAQGPSLVWRYHLSNIGRDGGLREWGEVEATTDAWGQVERVQIISAKLPSVAMRPGSFDYVDAHGFRFPLCCLPHSPIAMADRIDLVAPRNAPPPGIAVIADDRRSVVAGVQEADGRRLLVLRRLGETAVNYGDERLQQSVSGYALIDTESGLPYLDVLLSRVRPASGQSGALVWNMLHLRETRY